jgi:hypothetical protein
MVCKSSLLLSWNISIKTSKEKCVFMLQKVDNSQFSSFIGIFSDDTNDLWYAKMSSLSKLVFLLGLPEFLEISSSYCSFGVKQQSLTSLLIYQTLFLVVFEYFYDIYLFEIKHVCKLNWTTRSSEVLSLSVRRLLSITFHINIQSFS